MFLLTSYRRPSVAFYYFAWRLVEEEKRKRRELRGIIITQRCSLRKIEDPMDVSESKFKRRYRLSKKSFEFLCQELCSKTTIRASKRISLEHKVLCALSFYATGSYQRLVGISKHLGQSSVSKFVAEVTQALTSQKITQTFIKFPSSRAERDLIKQRFCRQYKIPGVCGCIDGSHFHIFVPKKEIEHLFYCRKHFHSLNVQIVCDSECRILNVNAKYGGATHDASIWENSQVNQYMQELHRNNEHVWLLGDSGYPQRPWLMTPIPDAAEGSFEAKYTSLHGQARVVIENTFGRLKNRWRCLSKDRTLHYTPEKCAKIIIACCVLHNIAVQFGVPDPEGYNTTIVETQDDIDMDYYVSTLDEGSQGDLTRGRAFRKNIEYSIE